jgi:hypothetical protein
VLSRSGFLPPDRPMSSLNAYRIVVDEVLSAGTPASRSAAAAARWWATKSTSVGAT